MRDTIIPVLWLWLAAAIIGASRPEQVADNVRASGVVLPSDVMTRIDEVLAFPLERA